MIDQSEYGITAVTFERGIMQPHLERVAREKGIALAELLPPDPQ